MITYLNGSKTAIIMLHEIYGINNFIKMQCEQYSEQGYDVYCPNLLGRDFFPYEKEELAYEYFMSNVGFCIYEKVKVIVAELKKRHDKVLVHGFSVGATIAWRCSDLGLCDGIICCYGSRIRDYLQLTPKCSILMIFAEKDSFPVNEIADKLEHKQRTKTIVLSASHGFMDSFNKNYNNKAATESREYINDFLNNI